MEEKDQLFMQRAIQLALLGRATVSPNPMVGCVITVDDRIIGEGWHQKAGEAHAEVRAIASVQDASLLTKATAYVTLEPCAHFGKTPPCANLLVEKMVKRVVIGCADPNPLVAGKGIEILRSAGIEVTLDCLKESCLSINKVFFHSIKERIPYVILKWAETADGFIAKENYDSKWISNINARQIVHKWRSESDAILVGKNTAKYDNPSLNVRLWAGKSPLRVVIDHTCSLSAELNIFKQDLPTLIYNTERNLEQRHIQWIKLASVDFYQQLLKDLYKRNIASLFIEGGKNTLEAFIEKGFWNEARIFRSQVLFESGISAPKLKNERLVSNEKVVANDLSTYINKKTN
ncbi:MAG: diaminohydroxyphosphoribosylaminopyrimidine deaminase [Marivirga sp.]|jgi:diaminohydroxyphosphoribosylaminopyrimidine deaminase/5-amino-6-(5-phosphoribosylamino)uracil reductase